MAEAGGVAMVGGKRAAETDLFRVLPACFDFIGRNRRSRSAPGINEARRKTVVMCETGLNQSVVVAIAWMMVGMGWKLDAAASYVKELVTGSTPSLGYLYQLVELEAAYTGHEPSLPFEELCDIFYPTTTPSSPFPPPAPPSQPSSPGPAAAAPTYTAAAAAAAAAGPRHPLRPTLAAPASPALHPRPGAGPLTVLALPAPHSGLYGPAHAAAAAAQQQRPHHRRHCLPRLPQRPAGGHVAPAPPHQGGPAVDAVGAAALAPAPRADGRDRRVVLLARVGVAAAPAAPRARQQPAAAAADRARAEEHGLARGGPPGPDAAQRGGQGRAPQALPSSRCCSPSHVGLGVARGSTNNNNNNNNGTHNFAQQHYPEVITKRLPPLAATHGGCTTSSMTADKNNARPCNAMRHSS
ncbi:hypothetical protein Pelo_11892 [Pelomyxa schiedti]|nr:hypothetical protein Pelo_11892 [Pelomyxa schiedti]